MQTTLILLVSFLVAFSQTQHTLIVPPNPLSAIGLSTPYIYSSVDETNQQNATFVEAVWFDPSTNQLAGYYPLVITSGTTPAVPNIQPNLPSGAVVGLWFSTNGNSLVLADNSNGVDLLEGNCVNGLAGSVFGTSAYCNAVEFFATVNNAISAGLLYVPPLGIAKDGLPCPSVRDFFIADNFQADGVATQYLVTSSHQLAALSLSNFGLSIQTVVYSASSTYLLSYYVAPALQCSSWFIPDVTSNGTLFTPTFATNQIQAASYQLSPIALVPLSNLFSINGQPSLSNTNLYREGADQIPASNLASANLTIYCLNLLAIVPPRLAQNEASLSAYSSPVFTTSTNLFAYLAQRFASNFELQCTPLLGIPSPVTPLFNSAGICYNATINLLFVPSSAPSASIYSSSEPVNPSQSSSPPPETSLPPVASSSSAQQCLSPIIPSPTVITAPPQLNTNQSALESGLLVLAFEWQEVSTRQVISTTVAGPIGGCASSVEFSGGFYDSPVCVSFYGVIYNWTSLLSCISSYSPVATTPNNLVISFPYTIISTEVYYQDLIGPVTRTLVQNTEISIQIPRTVAVQLGSIYTTPTSQGVVSAGLLSEFIIPSNIQLEVETASTIGPLQYQSIQYSGSATIDDILVIPLNQRNGSVTIQNFIISVSVNASTCYLNGAFYLSFIANGNTINVQFLITTDNICGQVINGPPVHAQSYVYSDALHTTPASTFSLYQTAYFRVVFTSEGPSVTGASLNNLFLTSDLSNNTVQSIPLSLTTVATSPVNEFWFSLQISPPYFLANGSDFYVVTANLTLNYQTGKRDLSSENLVVAAGFSTLLPPSTSTIKTTTSDSSIHMAISLLLVFLTFMVIELSTI